MPSHSFNYKGAKLYVEVDGNDVQPALLLYGPGSSNVRVWDHLINALTPHFHTVRIDVRGYGKSIVENLREDQFTLEQYAENASYVLATLGIDKTHIWSQSWGTRAAIVFCALNFDKVETAALYAANLGLPDVSAQRRGTKEAAEARRAASIDDSPTPDGFQVHEMPDAALLTATALRKINLQDFVDRLTMPLLIGTGSHDPNLVSSREIAQRLHHARLVEFELVGHNAILEHPALALSTFLGFHRL